MPEVNIKIADRPYRLTCDEGQEDQLIAMAGHLDRHAQELSAGHGGLPETRLLLMTALMTADELSDTLLRVKELEKEIKTLRSDADQRQHGLFEQAEEARLAGMLTEAAEKIEALTERLKA